MERATPASIAALESQPPQSRKRHRHKRHRIHVPGMHRYSRERWVRILLFVVLTLLASWSLVRLLDLNSDPERKLRQQQLQDSRFPEATDQDLHSQLASASEVFAQAS